MPVLMYHHIDQNWQESKLSVSPESFRRQMKFLKDHGYNVIRLTEFIDAIKSGQRLPTRTVAITFDDGYRDNYLYAWPVLKELNLPATIFVVVNLIDTKGYMSWEEVRELARSDIVDIGSHSLNHSWLPSLDQESLIKEIVDSKKKLEEKIGQPVKVFSYPAGAYDERVKQMVKKAGYIGACATNPEVNFKRQHQKYDPYAIARCRISRTSDNLLVFFIESSGYYTWIKSIRDEK